MRTTTPAPRGESFEMTTLFLTRLRCKAVLPRSLILRFRSLQLHFRSCFCAVIPHESPDAGCRTLAALRQVPGVHQKTSNVEAPLREVSLRRKAGSRVSVRSGSKTEIRELKADCHLAVDNDRVCH
ncbi:hypothetical protein LSAT2_012892 [Lamellibrachia satsuma]|nr:hypothetical protein LSAT2_012892 [Lamellibrachia satsuma]